MKCVIMLTLNFDNNDQTLKRNILFALQKKKKHVYKTNIYEFQNKDRTVTFFSRNKFFE